MKNIKSPLRYPGGKSKAIAQILPHIPLSIKEYREPFIGGGSVFFAINQLFKNKIDKYWINDLNYELYCFWLYAQKDIESLIRRVYEIKEKELNGHKLFADLTSDNISFNEFEKAVRFFVLNRISFSGTVDSGGYSQQAFEKRFTYSSIERLSDISALLNSVTITNLDYDSLLKKDGEDVFIFLDPPYLSATDSKLYGRRGNLHTSFDHQRFAENMRNCNHRWLITYDDSEEIRKLFDFANIIEWNLQYGMNNYKQKKAAKGKELMIKNYE